MTACALGAWGDSPLEKIPDPQTAQKSDSALYEVQPGDTLSNIARAHYHGPLYGNGGVLTVLLDLNNDVIVNPNLIFPGQTIRIKNIVTSENAGIDREPATVEDGSSDVAPSPSSSPSASPSDSPICSAAPTPEAEPEFKAFSQVSLLPSAWYSRYDATDTSTQGTAHILSSLYPEMDLNWTQYWSASTETHLNLSLAYYEADPQQSRAPSPDDYSLSSFGFGFSSAVSDRFKMGLDLNEAQAILIRGSNLTALTADRIQTTQPELTLRYDVANVNSLTFALTGGLSLVLPAQFNQYSMSLGSGYSGSAVIEQNLTNFSLRGALIYGRTNINTSIVQESATSLGFQLGIGWNFGK